MSAPTTPPRGKHKTKRAARPRFKPRAAHDRLIKLMFAVRAVTAGVLRTLMRGPWPEVVDLIDWSRLPEIVDARLTAKDGGHLEADAVVRLHTLDGGEVLVPVEHLSSMAAGIYDRIEDYAEALEERERGRGAAGGKRLLTLSLIIYHGAPPWNLPLQPEELVAAPAGMEHLARQSVLPCGLADLPRMPPEDLLLDEIARPFLLALARALTTGRVDDPRELAIIAEGVAASHAAASRAANGEDAKAWRHLIVFFRRYIAEWLDLKPELVDNARSETDAQPRSTHMTSMAQRYFDRGVTQGMTAGTKRGIRQGKAATLAELARVKFGELSPERAAQVEEASAKDLDRWLRMLIMADTLDGVFNAD